MIHNLFFDITAEKYCRLLKEEGGVEVLKNFNPAEQTGDIMCLVSLTLHNCERQDSVVAIDSGGDVDTQ